MNKKIILAVVVVLVVLGYVAYRNVNSSSTADLGSVNGTPGTSVGSETINPNTNPGSTITPPIPVTIDTSSEFKDGTYTAVGNYISPAGPESIKVSLTLKNDIITSAIVAPGEQNQNQNPNTVQYQGMFIANFKPLVIGKKITDVKLSKVSGSSLTSGGFNAAVAKIETQAQA